IVYKIIFALFCCILFKSDFVFQICGILLIVFGAQSLHQTTTIREVIDTPDTSAIFCIVIGVILFLIAFLGCCGAFRENHCMLITFSVIMLVILVIELILGGLVIAFKNEVKDLAREGLTNAMKKYDEGKQNSTYNEVVDEMQEKLKCCGVNNSADWISWNKTIPASCCAKKDKTSVDADNATCTEDKAFSQGCLHAFEEVIKSAYGPLGGVSITVAIVQLIGIVFACCLAYAVKKEYQVV
ncbi:CD63 antigen-like protein, partial [Leptotrombidium deliense]